MKQMKGMTQLGACQYANEYANEAVEVVVDLRLTYIE